MKGDGRLLTPAAGPLLPWGKLKLCGETLLERTGARGAHEAARQSRQGRHREGPQQAVIVEAHAPRVFRQAQVDQRGDVDVVADGLCTGHREIVVLLRAAFHTAGDAD